MMTRPYTNNDFCRERVIQRGDTAKQFPWNQT